MPDGDQRGRSGQGGARASTAFSECSDQSAAMNVMIIRRASIGAGVLCLLVATAIRRAFPDSRVTMLSSGHAAPLFDHHPDVH